MYGKWKLKLMGRGELKSQTSKQMMMTMMVTMMVMGSWIIYGTTPSSLNGIETLKS